LQFIYIFARYYICKIIYTIKRPGNHIIIEALHASGGLIQPASISLKVTRKTLYDWIKNDPELQEYQESEKEANIDFAEGQLKKLMRDENPTAILFYLKTIGRNRGYIEKQEIEHQGGININLIDGL
jgi:hypothetical protein